MERMVKQGGPPDQDHRLESLNDHDGTKSAQDAVQGGNKRYHQNGYHDINPEEGFEYHCPGVETDPDVGEEGGDYDQEGEEGAGPGSVSLLQEFGQGRDLVPEIEGGKKQGQDDQQKGGHPFEVPPDDSVLKTIGCQSNHMNGGNIGCKQCCSDHGPVQGAARQEKAFTAHFLPAGRQHTNENDYGQVSQDNNQVQGGNIHLFQYLP